MPDLKRIAKHMYRHLLVLALVGLLISCAKPPRQEMDAAEYMVRKAEDMQAAVFAPAEYQAAHTALNDARRAMKDADYDDARDAIEYALLHARRAVAMTEESKARLAEENAQKKEDARKAIETERALRAERAQKETTKTEDKPVKKPPVAKQATPAPAPAPTPVPAPAPKPQIELVDEYIVGEGENLWTISAQPRVYGEGLLWPLLYQANRDQIKDPRQIFPGQTLGIRRDMSDTELEEARQKARQSDIFPVPAATPPSR